MVRPRDASGLVGLTAQPSSAQPSSAQPSSAQPSSAQPSSAQPSSAQPSRAGRNTARRWGLLLIVGWLVQVGLRAWLSRAQVVPLATPDESAYLIAARVLAGGSPANFSYSTLYPAGYPLLITPVFWFTSNPVTAYHAVLMINAPISAALMPLGYLACRRLGLDRPAAYAVAAVTALLPAAFFYAEYAMTDAIYPVLVLAWAAHRAQLADRLLGPGPVRGGDRLRPAGRAGVRGPLQGPGDRAGLPGRGHRDRGTPSRTARHGGGGRRGPGAASRPAPWCCSARARARSRPAPRSWCHRRSWPRSRSPPTQGRPCPRPGSAPPSASPSRPC